MKNDSFVSGPRDCVFGKICLTKRFWGLIKSDAVLTIFYLITSGAFDTKMGVRCEDSSEPVFATHDLIEAKEKCAKDKKCLMFYDACGDGELFRTCTALSPIIKSKCVEGNIISRNKKDILYVKGKY